MDSYLMPNSDKISFNKIAQHPLQTWEWGEFRKSWGNKVERFAFGQITIHKIPKTSYSIGVFEKGPAPNQEMIEMLKDYARKNNLIFIKLEPNYIPEPRTKENAEISSLLKKNGCVKGKRVFTPSTFYIDLKKSEEELLQSFTSKTRYNIRVAQKHGVKVIEDNSEEAFQKYLELTLETSKRQGFFAHSEKYHRLMWKYLHTIPIQNQKKPIARLLTAVYRGEIITTWIVFVWKNFLYYPYGASSDKYRFAMANNLMMWEAIRLGIKLKLTTFDLWGREEGKGFTRFKEGYNPKVVEFLGTWDLVVNKPMYLAYKIADSMRWKLLKSFGKIRSRIS